MGGIVQIVGFSSSYKVPGYFAETVYGAGAITVGSIPLICLVVGNKTSAGSATADQDLKQVLSVDDADAYFGPGAEISVMCYAGLIEEGVLLWGCPNAEAGGAVAGTGTITIASAATSSGTWAYWIDGNYITGGIANGDSATTTAAAIVAAVNGNTRLPVTAANVNGVVTLTSKSKGIRANQHTLFQDATKMPTGQTSAVSGGTAITGGGVFFTGGSGSDSLTNVFTILFPGTYDRIAIAQNDATNAAAFVTQLNSKAGVLEGRLEHGVMAVSGSLSSATTLATVSLNAERVQLLWLLNSPAHPPALAARMAAKRTATEQADPNASYDDAILTGSTTCPLLGQFAAADNPSQATEVSALNNGITPLKTTTDGKVAVVRSITSHSLNGSNPDYRTLDTSDAYVPDFIRKGLDLVWTTEFLPANKRVQDDPAPGAKEAPAGAATPSLWTKRATRFLKDQEAAPALVVQDVDANPVQSGFDSTAKRIMSAVPVIPAANQHQIGVSVRNVTAA
jgi:phage tail sheath gpL-like